MKTEDLLLWLKGQNITEVAENTGIPKDRMYKWTNGVASPKTEDFQKLLKYYESVSGKTSTSDRVKELANTDLPHPPPANLTEYLLLDKLTYMQKELETLKKEIGKLKDKNVKD